MCGVVEDADLTRLSEMAVECEVAAGTAFIEEGQAADTFFNVTAGTARLIKSLPDGRRQIIGFAGVGHFLGLAVSDIYAFGAEALGPMRLCRFSRAGLRQLLDEFPVMEQRLLAVARDELVAAQEQMLLLGRKTARERLASFLLAYPRAASCPARTEDVISLPMTRADIADYLGLTVETVSRTLTRLRTGRVIAVPSAAMILIRDRATLASIAAGEV